MDRLLMAIATGFGLGYLPKAPGTWGTLLAFPIHYLLSHLPLPLHILGILLIIILAIFTAGSAEKILDQPDPGIVVIDEVAGMLITLLLAPPTVLAWGIAFALFRFFDIVKPFPVNWFDRRFHGGPGIVLDDLVAGVYGLICLQLIGYFLNL